MLHWKRNNKKTLKRITPRFRFQYFMLPRIYGFKAFMSQGPALQCDLSTLEGESWEHAPISEFIATPTCWAHLRQFSAVEKEEQRFARIQCGYLMSLQCFSNFSNCCRNWEQVLLSLGWNHLPLDKTWCSSRGKRFKVEMLGSFKINSFCLFVCLCFYEILRKIIQPASTWMKGKWTIVT